MESVLNSQPPESSIYLLFIAKCRDVTCLCIHGGGGGQEGGRISDREWWTQGEQGVSSQNAVSPKWEKDIGQDFWAWRPRKKMPTCISWCHGEHWYGFVYWCLFIWNLRVTPPLCSCSQCFLPCRSLSPTYYSLLFCNFILCIFRGFFKSSFKYLGVSSPTNIFSSALYLHLAMAFISFLLLKQTCWMYCFYLLTLCSLFDLVSCPTKTHHQHVRTSNEHFQITTLLILSAEFGTFIIFKIFLASLFWFSSYVCSRSNILCRVIYFNLSFRYCWSL